MAITGISWGGYLTCIVAGLDDRLKAAVPSLWMRVLAREQCLEGTTDGFSPERRDRWVKSFRSLRVPPREMPNSVPHRTNDFAYPLTAIRSRTSS